MVFLLYMGASVFCHLSSGRWMMMNRSLDDAESKLRERESEMSDQHIPPLLFPLIIDFDHRQVVQHHPLPFPTDTQQDTGLEHIARYRARFSLEKCRPRKRSSNARSQSSPVSHLEIVPTYPYIHPTVMRYLPQPRF